MQQDCASKQFFLKNLPVIGSWRGETDLIIFCLLKKSVIYYVKAIILTGVIGMRHVGILVLVHLY